MAVTSLEIYTGERLAAVDGRNEFFEVLALYPEINALPEAALIQPGDTLDRYVARCINAEMVDQEIEQGVYMTDPSLGKLYLPDMAVGPGQFTKLVPNEKVETKGLSSNNGFFAHNFSSPEGARIRLAFRPFDPKINDCVTEDFAKNMIIPHLGIGSLQTIGFYKGAGDRGGTISLLDPGIRSIDQINTDTLNAEDHNGMTIFEGIAKELAFIHAVGVAHGDVSLRNIVRTDHNRVFFIDWGKAMGRRQSENDLSVNGTAQHDILSLYNDFVWYRASADGKAKIRNEYRDFLNVEFFSSYIKWRIEFNDSKDVAERLSHKALSEELEMLKRHVYKKNS